MRWVWDARRLEVVIRRFGFGSVSRHRERVQPQLPHEVACPRDDASETRLTTLARDLNAWEIPDYAACGLVSSLADATSSSGIRRACHGIERRPFLYGERCRSQGIRDEISVILDSMDRERDANDAPGNRQYRVVSRRVGDRTRRTLVVVAQGPLAAALDAFARLYSSPPEVIDVSALHSAGEQSFLVTIEAAPRERYRLFVALDRIDPPSRAGTR